MDLNKVILLLEEEDKHIVSFSEFARVENDKLRNNSCCKF